MKKKDKQILEQIKNILLKKAEGYFYNEEIFEYISPTDNKEEDSKITQKTVSPQLNFLNLDIQSNQKKGRNEQRKESANLILSKKKVTTHYIPPDITAIKMLVENFGQEVDKNDNLDAMSDQELINLRNKLLSELKNIN